MRSRLPRILPISETPPVKYKPEKDAVKIKLGDLVVWKDIKKDSSDDWFYKDRKCGIVLDVRWALCDWIRIPEDSIEYYAEAVVLWDNRDTTQTSVEALKILSRPVQPRAP